MTVREDPTASTRTPAPTFGSGIADPGALGLGAFALTTFCLSLANAQLIPQAVFATLGLALFYGGLGQLLAGMWEFVKGNTFGATAFTSYGAFWLAFWWLETNPKVAEQAGGAGVGIFLLAFGIFTLYMTFAALRTTTAILIVFILLTLTFLVLAVGEFSGATGISIVGGIIGILTALAAWYASFATVMNATWKRVVLPVGPRA